MISALKILEESGMVNLALILEDIPEARAWMAGLLLKAYPHIEIKQACSIEQARMLCKEFVFDLALVDLSLPDGSGSNFILELSQKYHQTISVVVTIYDDDQHIFPALQAGAKGYLLKDMPAPQFITRLQGIASGEPALSAPVAGRLLNYFASFAPIPENTLSPREQEVLTLIAKGYKLPEVSSLLKLSPHTVSGYIKIIYRKLNITSRAQATLEATRLGLVKP